MRNKIALCLMIFAFFCNTCFGGQFSIAVGGATNRANRLSNEDTFVARSSVIAVFDGAAGDDLSKYAAEWLNNRLDGKNQDKDVAEVFYETHEQAKSLFGRNDDDRTVDGHLYSPKQCLTTGAVVHLGEGEKNIVVDWIGNTRAIIISKDFKVSYATTDHIRENAGISLLDLDDYLKIQPPVYSPPITKGVGGLRYQRYQQDRFYGDMTSEQDFQIKKIDNNDLCVLIASSGVWNVLSNDEVTGLVESFIKNNKITKMCADKCNELSEHVIQEALKKNDKNNVTVAVMFFEGVQGQRSWKKIVCMSACLAAILIGCLYYFKNK